MASRCEVTVTVRRTDLGTKSTLTTLRCPLAREPRVDMQTCPEQMCFFSQHHLYYKCSPFKYTPTQKTVWTATANVQSGLLSRH